MAIATFDTTIHFYSLRPSQSQPQMLVVPDIAQPYAPQPANLLCNAKESRELVRGASRLPPPHIGFLKDFYN